MLLSKTYLFVFFVFTSIFACISQSKNIVFIDELTKEPIEEVYLWYPLSEESSFTNVDGVATIFIKKEHLKITHVNYQEITIDYKKIIKLDTIKLRSRNFKIKKKIANSFNLKKELQYVLDNYDNLYLDYATEKECSFKSTLTINEEIHRLIVSELRVWSKDAALKRRELDKVIKLKLGSVHSHSDMPMALDIDKKETSNSEANEYVTMKKMLANSYLDVVIGNFLKFSGKIEETIEESASDIIVISFRTAWRKTNKVSDRILGRAVFDKRTKAIIEFSREIELKSDDKNEMSNLSNKKDRYEIENQFIKYHFNKKSDGKYSLKAFTISSDIVLSYENMGYNVNIENKLFVLKETKLKKMDTKKFISLDDTMYQATPSNKVNTNSITLSEEEKVFLDSKK